MKGTELRKMSVPFKAKKIKEGILREIWNRKFSDKPFPKVKAFKMPNKRYLETIKKMREDSKEKTEAQDLREYGRILNKGEVENLQGLTVLDGISGGFFILVNEDSILSLSIILEHELNHVHEGLS